MALSSYCRRCSRDVPVGDVCPCCGGKLAASAVRLTWRVEHTPLRDWMCWNAVMRIALPGLALALGLAVALEGFHGGPAGVAAMFRQGLTEGLAWLAGLFLAALLIVFALQGKDILDCVLDSKGCHVQVYLPQPTPLKLAARFRSPGLMRRADPELPLLLASREIAWKDVARVQLWPEKTLLLLYAPRWWLRVAIPCTPLDWEDALTLVSDKLGRKKAVELPQQLLAPPKPRQVKADLAEQANPAELPPLEPLEPITTGTEERAEDFISLQEVLQEIKDAERLRDL